MISEDPLHSVLIDDYESEVDCKNGIEKRHNSWYGARTIRAVTLYSICDKTLVTKEPVQAARVQDDLWPVSFLDEIGCKTANIPLEHGARERHAASERMRMKLHGAKRQGNRALAGV
nr:hypothetical protein [Roseobacter litoralis]